MAARLLIALLTALALVGGGYWWGQHATDNAWTARQAQAAEEARADLEKANERADKAAASYLQDHIDQEDRYAALDDRYQELRRRAPLVVYRPVAAGVGSVVADGGAPRDQEQKVPHERPAAGAADDGGSLLTLAAVRMWNGALTGTDAPAGACGLASAPEGADAACAESSGLTLDDAWANHTANAKTCAADRQRFRALIEFLNNRENP